MNRPPFLRASAWLVALTLTGLALWLLGRTSLAAPPLAPARWAAWAGERDPLTAAMAVLRLLALTVTAYLWVTTALHLAASVSRSSLLHGLATAVTVPAARRLLGGAAGLGLSAAVVLAPVATAAGVPRTGGPAGSGGTASMHEVGPPPSDPPKPSTTIATTQSDSGVVGSHIARERELPPPSTTAVAPASPDPSTAPPPAPESPSTTATPPGTGAPSTTSSSGSPAPASPGGFPDGGSPTSAGTWTVAPGDNFWFEAAHVLARAWGRSPSDAEIVPYWRTLVEANRAALADPANPDLIFPGQRFTVPPAPPA